ncbi:NADP-dependent isocitrate dehydrogenase [Rhodocytophaga rosea]|uniref:Isocitrate dehydrogenase [NADP] n=1 Tax=Rhodocytophaga rosea TaxID=2704465 RepID=A0A6C0GI18_9BACT|nr:NADP-dependent isocitrate dehydrogenase [Rhodocytophaga rosea]QHT67332.1 NADP-dependent isocitrate dehydrogenase [Rhodocytophaga rosea]QHT70801.1 NADP-dependent isocitrate dehydrogenase [Rhodocytophaga rosea]
MLPKTPITFAYGDGIGPEIMDATIRILTAAGAAISPEVIEIGEKVYLQGNTSGIDAQAWDSLRKTKIFLKAPITTPLGSGYKSLNVTIRKTLGLFANVRPCLSLHPFVTTKHPRLDVIIIRENEEDVYAGIEHQQSADVVQCLKLITRPGCEKIIRYAFEYAKTYGRKKVTCMTKNNIMKLTDGLFYQTFQQIGAQYPEIEKEHQIIDIGAALLADQPEKYDVVVTLNLYGDIISDVVAQIAGSVGLAGSANIGDHCTMFEAIHGSAPDIAGKNIANPSGLIQASILMLMHIGQNRVAERIHNAWLATIESGSHTADIFRQGVSKAKVGTQQFADQVIGNLDTYPAYFPKVNHSSHAPKPFVVLPYQRPVNHKQLVGADIFVCHDNISPDQLGDQLTGLTPAGLKLKMITNRGVKVYPQGHAETFCTDHWRCRFVAEGTVTENADPLYVPLEYSRLLSLQEVLSRAGLEIIKTENLYTFNGKRGFSLGQGE